jgi:Trk K+ transport system NAD-binding subunit
VKPKVLTYTISLKSIYLGQVISSVELPDGCHILGIARAGNLLLPQQNPTLEEGDWLIAIALDDALSPALKLCLSRSQNSSWSQPYSSIVLA